MKKNLGFTLIELIIAIAIGMLVVGFGSVALNESNEKQKVEAVRQELLANLRLARNYATTEQFPDDTPEGTDRVTINIDNNGLMVAKAQWLNKQTQEVADTGYVFYSRDITPKGIIINAPEIKFSVTNGRSIGGTANVSVTGEDGTVKNIKIDESGLIYEE